MANGSIIPSNNTDKYALSKTYDISATDVQDFFNKLGTAILAESDGNYVVYARWTNNELYTGVLTVLGGNVCYGMMVGAYYHKLYHLGNFGAATTTITLLAQ